MELLSVHYNIEYESKETKTNVKLLMITHALYGNKYLLVRVTPSKLKTFVLTLN